MNANLVNLRRNPKRILEAVEKRETVILTRRGKPIARIVNLEEGPSSDPQDHEAFGIWEDRDEVGVEDQVRNLRKGRFHDL